MTPGFSVQSFPPEEPDSKGILGLTQPPEKAFLRGRLLEGRDQGRPLCVEPRGRIVAARLSLGAARLPLWKSEI